MKKRLESKHETHEGRPPRGGAESRHEGGFAEGEYGRGPTPYKRSHSSKPSGHSLASHSATSGRGGPGVFGGKDQHKGSSTDLEHPDSHAAFEGLGAD